jgi:hypothetical protein
MFAPRESRDGAARVHYFQDLNLRGRRIGMIGLARLRQDRHFSTEDLDLLKALSGYAAIAIENASLYRSIETKALELERLKNYTENIIESINVAVLALDLSPCHIVQSPSKICTEVQRERFEASGREPGDGRRHRLDAKGDRDSGMGSQGRRQPVQALS